MSDIGALVERLVAAGLSVGEAGEIIATAFAAGAASSGYRKSPGSVRQQRWRERNKASQSVTVETPSDDRGEASQSVSNRNEASQRNAAPLSIEKKEEVKKEKKERARASQLPADWCLDEIDIEYAVSKGIPRSKVPLVGEAFSNHHRAKGTVFADWRAAWRKWCGNEIKFHGGMNGTAQVRPGKSLTDNIRRELAELEGSESTDLALSARPVLLISR
jgi:hypothetical protein